MKGLGFAILLLVLAVTVQAQWQLQKVNTQAGFRGLSVVNDRIVWASGTGGAFVRTADGGRTWRTGQVAGAEKLDFRDVEAFDDQTAYLLSIGPGESSRIYRTDDGGANWALQFQNTDPEAFYDALAFWDRNHGLAMSDPVGGRFVLLRTDDGKTWTPVASEGIPSAVAGEGGFAASGTCLITHGKNTAYLVSGGTGAARVYRSTDRGKTWRVVDSPLLRGTAGAGIFSIACITARHCAIVGGDYQKPEAGAKNAALTTDGGLTWRLAESTPAGYRSGVAYMPQRRGRVLLAVGTSGTDISTDSGANWTQLDAENFNAVAFAPNATAWAAGPNGRLAKRTLKGYVSIWPKPATAVNGEQGAVKVDEISLSTQNIGTNKAILDYFAMQLQARPGDLGVFISYLTKNSQLLRCFKQEVGRDFLINTKGMLPDRLMLVPGGYRDDCKLELWLVPPGAEMPKPRPEYVFVPGPGV